MLAVRIVLPAPPIDEHTSSLAIDDGETYHDRQSGDKSTAILSGVLATLE